MRAGREKVTPRVSGVSIIVLLFILGSLRGLKAERMIYGGALGYLAPKYASSLPIHTGN